MKNQLFQVLWIGLFLLSGSIAFSQNNVAINTTGAAPDSSAILDVQSMEKGMLIPRMTSEQRDLISSPADGLLVYDSDTESFWFHQTGQWSELVNGKAGLRDMDDDTKILVEEAPDDDGIRFLAGGRNVGFLSWPDSLETNIGFDAGTYASSTAGTHVGYAAGVRDSGLGNTLVGANSGSDTLSGEYNTFIGSFSGSATQSGYSNTFVGGLSGALNKGGYYNSFTGYASGQLNTTGHYNSFFGTGAGTHNLTGIQNTFIGGAAGFFQKHGENNTYLGLAAGQGSMVDTNGNRNTALGAFAGFTIGSGERNTMVGSYSGRYLSAGVQNTFLGASSGYSTTMGERNVFLGDGSGYYNTEGSWNTFVGDNAGVENVDGNNNVAIGQSALNGNIDRSFLVAIGDSALYNNGVGATQSYEAVDNTAVGASALFSNTKGFGNTGLGRRALYHNTTGDFNTATGFDCLRFNISGYNNTASGYAALGLNTSGRDNAAIGYFAMVNNANGNDNAAFGGQALYSNLGGYSNTAVGKESLLANTSGNNNTAIGYQALVSNITGDMNTAIGYLADVSSSNLTNATAIGANAVATQSNSLVLGSGANVSIGNSTPNQLLSVGDDLGSYLTGNRITVGNESGISGLNIGEDIDNRAFMLWNNTDNFLEIGMRSAGISYGSTFVIKNGRAGINNTAPIYDLHVGNGNINATNGSDTRMVVSDNDNEDRAAILGLAKTTAGAKVEAQLEANGSNTSGPSVIVGAASSHPLYIRTGNLTRMTVTSGGDVGIGTSSPSTKLHVVGNVTATCGVLSCSDARYKKNVTPMVKVLSGIRELQGVYYYWDQVNFPENAFSSDRQIGIIAQELEKNFPELVQTDQDGYKTVDYAKLSAVLLQALNEQEMEIKALHETLAGKEKVITDRLKIVEEKLGLSSSKTTASAEGKD